MKRDDVGVLELLGEQWFVAHRIQLALVGLTEAMLRRRLRDGWLEAVSRDVVRLRGSPRVWEQRAMAGALCAGLDAVLGFEAAAAVHGLRGARRGAIEVVQPRGERHARPLARVHETQRLPPSHQMRVGALPVTTPARTLCDLAARMPVRQLGRTVDAALSKGILSLDVLRSVHDDLAPLNRRGKAVMREVLRRRPDGYVAPASDLEAKAFQSAVSAGAPPWLRQFDVVTERGWLARTDGGYTDVPLLVEVDSDLLHTNVSDRAADAERDDRLRAAGFVVLRIPERVVESPAVVGNLVRTARREAEAVKAGHGRPGSTASVQVSG